MKYTDEEKTKMIEDLWASSNRKLFNYLGRYKMSREEREDTVSEAFARAFKSLDTWKGTCKLESWLFQIAKNIYLNKIRYDKCKKRDRVGLDVKALIARNKVSAAAITDPILQAELDKIVDGVIRFKFKRRPEYIEPMRDIFIHNTDMSQSELAEAYGVTAMSIRREKFKTGRKLLEKLEVFKVI